MREIDLSKAILRDEAMFAPFCVPARGMPLDDAKLKPQEELLVMERNGAAIAFVLKQMAYHHVAQGEHKAEPYLISF